MIRKTHYLLLLIVLHSTNQLYSAAYIEIATNTEAVDNFRNYTLDQQQHCIRTFASLTSSDQETIIEHLQSISKKELTDLVAQALSGLPSDELLKILRLLPPEIAKLLPEPIIKVLIDDLSNRYADIDNLEVSKRKELESYIKRLDDPKIINAIIQKGLQPKSRSERISTWDKLSPNTKKNCRRVLNGKVIPTGLSNAQRGDQRTAASAATPSPELVGDLLNASGLSRISISASSFLPSSTITKQMAINSQSNSEWNSLISSGPAATTGRSSQRQLFNPTAPAPASSTAALLALTSPAATLPAPASSTAALLGLTSPAATLPAPASSTAALLGLTSPAATLPAPASSTAALLALTSPAATLPAPASSTAALLALTSPAANLPAPASSIAPAPASSIAPAPASSIAPAPASSIAPAPASSIAPAPASSIAPAPASSIAPAPASSIAPAPASSIAPAPASSIAPAPASSIAPAPASSIAPAPASSIAPAPASSIAPAPASSIAPAPASSIAPAPASSIAPAPASSIAPAPASSIAPAPASPAANLPASANPAAEFVTKKNNAFKTSLSAQTKVLAGATILGIAGGLAALLHKMLSEGERQVFRSIENNLKRTYEVNPELINELNALYNALTTELLENGTTTDVSEHAKTLNKFFDESNLKSFTQNLQTIANRADSDFKDEWNTISAKHAAFINAWQNIRTVLSQNKEPQNPDQTDLAGDEGATNLAQVRNTLNEMSLYLDLINRACELSTPSVN